MLAFTKTNQNTHEVKKERLLRNFWNVDRRMGQKQKKEKTEGATATGLGRITREQIEKSEIAQLHQFKEYLPPGPLAYYFTLSC